MLNVTETMIFVKDLLDEPSVYGFEDITEGDSAETQMESALNRLSDEVLFNELLDVLTEDLYDYIKNKSYTDYDYNDKKLFYAECYFIAALFLEKYALKKETENFKTQLDFSNKISTTEKSGKIFSAYEYRKKANLYLSKIDEYSSVEPEGRSMSIRRF